MIFIRLLKEKKGQAMVEMAIVLPILLLVLMSIFEFGRIFNAYLLLNNASREGARSAALGGSDTEITQTINNLTTNLDYSHLTTTISPSKSNRKRGTEAVVNIQYDIDVITPFIGAIIPNPLHLESKTIMRVE